MKKDYRISRVRVEGDYKTFRAWRWEANAWAYAGDYSAPAETPDDDLWLTVEESEYGG